MVGGRGPSDRSSSPLYQLDYRFYSPLSQSLSVCTGALLQLLLFTAGAFRDKINSDAAAKESLAVGAGATLAGLLIVCSDLPRHRVSNVRLKKRGDRLKLV